MTKLRIVEVNKLRTPWMVGVRASITGTKLVRRYFSDREKAVAYVIAVNQQGFFEVERSHAGDGKMTLGECAARWLARHEQNRLASSQIRTVLVRLVARHGRDPIDVIGRREIDASRRAFGTSSGQRYCTQATASAL